MSASVIFFDTHSGGYGRFVAIGSTVLEKQVPTYTDKDYVDTTKEMLKQYIPSETSLDLNLYTSNSFQGLTISWNSSNNAAFSSDGKIGSSSNESEVVVLTAVITLNGISEEVTFTITVKFAGEISIKDVLTKCDDNDESAVRFKGKVVAFDAYDYPYIADETGIVYIRTKLSDGLKLGDCVRASGIASVYENSGKQYARHVTNATFTKIEEEVTVQKAVKVNISDLGSLTITDGVITEESVANIKNNDLFGSVIEITGYVTLRTDYENAYISVDNDTTSSAVLYYHLSDNQDEIKEYAGKMVTIVCSLYDYQATNGWRLGSYLSISEVA